MLDFLLNIPYHLGKDAELLAVLQKRAPNFGSGALIAKLREVKRGRPGLTVPQLEEYLSQPIKYRPLFDVTMEIMREIDGAKFTVDTLWGLDGHVIAPNTDTPGLMKFVTRGKKSGCCITVALKEDPSVLAEVTLGKHTFETPDTSSLQSWYSARYDENGNPLA